MTPAEAREKTAYTTHEVDTILTLFESAETVYVVQVYNDHLAMWKAQPTLYTRREDAERKARKLTDLWGNLDIRITPRYIIEEIV